MFTLLHEDDDEDSEDDEDVSALLHEEEDDSGDDEDVFTHFHDFVMDDDGKETRTKEVNLCPYHFLVRAWTNELRIP